MNEIMVTVAQRSTSDRMVGLSDCAVAVIKGVLTTGGACD